MSLLPKRDHDWIDMSLEVGRDLALLALVLFAVVAVIHFVIKFW